MVSILELANSRAVGKPEVGSLYGSAERRLV
jgi:hypothetical protein